MREVKLLYNKFKNILAALLFFLTLCFSSNSFAGIDTTVFRIKAVQDSVYIGDTVDVDIFIGGNGLLGLNILKSFEIEIVSDTSLFEQDKIKFKLDSAALETFFGTVISNITTITNIDPILGKLNIKTNSTTVGSGNERVGRGNYIVQDNVAGRQQMPFDFSKAISKDLLGFNNPVKVVIDSVLIIGPRNQIPTAININKNSKLKITPNPANNIIYVTGEKVQQYKLINIVGNEIFYETNIQTDNFQINIERLNKGIYVLMLLVDGNWNNYNVVKE